MRCKSILIAEDNDDIRETLEEILKNEGYLVYSSKNGKDAMVLLDIIDRPALVFLDLMMPVMSGWEFLDAKKKKARRPKGYEDKIVTISAVASTASLQDMTPLKVDGVIRKPLVLEEILETVEEFCGAPEALPIAI